MHAAQQPADHAGGAGAAARRLRVDPPHAQHVGERIPARAVRPVGGRRLEGGAVGVLRGDVEQPRLLEDDEQLPRPPHRQGRQRRVVRVPRRQDPRHRRRSRDRRQADPRPSLRPAPPAVRHELLRDVQQPEGLARRPQGDADLAGDRAWASRPPTASASSTSSCGRPASTSAPAPSTGWASAVGDGLALEEYWADGPSTYLGVACRGFPNFFFPGGPHGSTGNNPRYAGDQVDFVTDALVFMRERGRRRRRGDAGGRGRTGAAWSTPTPSTAPFSEASYFFGANIPGKPIRYLLNPGGRPKLQSSIARAVADGFQSFEFDRVRGTAGRPPIGRGRAWRRTVTPRARRSAVRSTT